MSNTFESNSWLHQPLAIVGMSCRLPGGDGLEQFWDSLVAGKSSIRRFPEERLDRRLYYDSEKGVRGKTYTDLGGFVAERELDWSLLGISREEARQWDPCHLNLCEVAARALMHAGYQREALAHRKTGVFVGHSGGSTLGGELAYRTLAEDYVRELESVLANQSLDSQAICKELLSRLQEGRPRREGGYPRVDASYAAALISRTLGLNGNSISIDAACASSLVALALAANSLQAGESDMALVGGASFNKADSLVLFSHAQSCSAEGSRPFDEQANGLIGSEGYVVLVVKTLAQAEKDGDEIEAVIRGIGISSDGRGRSLWAPRKEGQYKAIERAYSSSVRPDSVQLIEAHATSTQVGDATEMEALSAFYSQHIAKDRRIPVGSVKSNIGHTLETAGLAGLLKSVLAIQHRAIPPSIGVERLSSSIPWEEIPLYVPTSCEGWDSDSGNPRRAAVNAFGIGGLNVHVVVDEFVPNHEPKDSVSPHNAAAQGSTSRIAVVGRGLVLPTARNLGELDEPPCRQEPASPLARIEGFEYDWRKHKVPPKQIAHANPLQFMLLDAAQQAFQDAGLEEGSFDRQRAAVVVGSPFGGDFGNALFAGLRLPEFRDRLARILTAMRVDGRQIDEIVAAYEKAFLNKHPALLDETGSFTSSTLASRLSKTFDLMGGAMAVDAGDCSGLAAVSSAMQLLNSGTVDLVLCAAAHSALDAAAVENLQQLGRFPASSQPVVGEGVVLLLLQREETALQEKRQIQTLLHSSAVSFGPEADNRKLAAVIRDSIACAGDAPASCTGKIGVKEVDDRLEQALKTVSTPGHVIAPDLACARRAMGYLQAVQPLADIVDETLKPTLASKSQTDLGQAESKLIVSHTSNGLNHALQVSPYREMESQKDSSLPEIRVESQPVESIFKFEAQSRLELQQMLEAESPERLAVTRFQRDESLRCVLACSSDEIRHKANRFSNLISHSDSPSQYVPQGIYWAGPEHRSQRNRVAWMFPGQGSQYPGMLQSLVAQDPAAQTDLDRVNGILQSKGGPSFEQIAWGASSLGDDFWQTQVAMLIGNWLVAQHLHRAGAIPDTVVGHSFGEFSALLEAKSWTLEHAMEATWQRCQALEAQAPLGLLMLGVQADAATVTRLLASNSDQVFVSHRNAPEQTVIGGRRASVIDASRILEEQGIATRLLAVPTAFHTPALEPVCSVFQQALASVPTRPVQLPLLSGVSNRYVADPEEVRQLLVQQLIQPIDFVAMVQRLWQDGITTFVEVGSQQVLSKLVRQIQPKAHVFSCDHPKAGAFAQLQFVLAQLECMGLLTSSMNEEKLHLVNPIKASSPIHFDATEKRKARLRNSSSEAKRWDIHARPAGGRSSHHDATAERRERNSGRVVVAKDAMPQDQASQPFVLSKANQAIDVSAAGESTEVLNREALAQLLVDFVVEQTGYPAEIIELDWDIEADLGIDSIKKAQLFGELREFFEFEHLTKFSLDGYKTLHEIVNLLETLPPKRELSPSVPTASEEEFHSLSGDLSPTDPSFASQKQAEQGLWVESVADVQSDLSGGHASPSAEEEYTRVLIDFVVEQTGYPREIVELDADLEADLGIDSIKQAQLIGELRELFGTDLKSAAVSHASKNQQGFGSLRAILEFLLEHQTASSKGLADKQDEGQATPLRPSPMQPIEENVGLQNSPLETTAQREAMADREAMVQVEPSAQCEAMASLDTLQNVALKPGLPLSDAESAARDNYARLVSSACSERAGSFTSCDQIAGIDIDPFARQLGVQTDLVRQLEHELVTHCYWKPLAKEPGTNGNGNPLPNTEWIAELKGPEWLIRNRDSGFLELDHEFGTGARLVKIAGSRFAHACVLDGRYVIVANANSKLLEDQLEVQQWFEAIREMESPTPESVLSAARKIESRISCFCIIHDVFTGQTKTVLTGMGVGDSENKAICQEYSAGLQSRGLNGSCLARLGLDRNTGEIVLSSEFDYGRQRLTLPVDGQSKAEDELANGGAVDGLKDDCRGVLKPEKLVTSQVASRYVLKMAPSPLREPECRNLEWQGAAVIVGDNAVARQLDARLRLSGVETHCMTATKEDRSLQKKFQELASSCRVPYLFLATPWDTEAETKLDANRWQPRRDAAVYQNFWLCQSWLGHVIETGMAQEARLVALTAMGGDFGFSGDLYSTEGGALAGLLKSMLIETWTQGVRPLPIKILDSDIKDSPAQVVENLWQELASPSYDFEVAYRDQTRHVVRAIPRPLATDQLSRRQPAGTWVCTGGARGITAYVAEQLALRYDLNLQLIGKSPVPEVDPGWQELQGDDLRILKTQIMTRARSHGKNPVVAWQDTEKAIEIDATLRRLRELGIEAQYHQCDVADAVQVEKVLRRIRDQVGPITGILHGAGVGRDARFDRKQPEKVQQCIEAKVDGAIALMSATKHDPLEYFIGFGSISGRFGANGHTDYSLANEMLCKQIDWFSKQRPEVKSIGFHWHAWGDVGMATKPETRLALEMINMQFMPAAEGIEHLVQELESDSQETEVLITDDRYYRMFFPSDALVNGSTGSRQERRTSSPLFARKVEAECGGQHAYLGTLDPVRDPFLAEHRLGGSPLLPFVVAAEMMLESSWLAGHETLQIRGLEATQAMRFFNDEPRSYRAELQNSPRGMECSLYSDFKTRAGKLVESNRRHFRGILPLLEQPVAVTRHAKRSSLTWAKPSYPEQDSEFYVGWPFQRLRQFALLDDGLIGRISAPALIELAGSDRDLTGWLSPSAALDTCLFATGILAWQRVAPGSALPSSIGLLTVSRLPAPGESLEVHVQLNSTSEQRASFDLSLFGVDGSLILNAQDYEVAWLGRPAAGE